MRSLFSLVVPTYNVVRHLQPFLDSLAGQTYPVDDIEVVFVDDGSTDRSAEVIAAWIASVAPSATLLRKENGGLSSARNAGLDRVTGTWVTFCDPDDTLPPNYFSAVAEFIDEHRADDLHLVACRLLVLDDLTAALRDEHPLRFRFEAGDQVVDLDRHPEYIHLSAASGFYRTDLIEQRSLRFDGRVKPNFEDAVFSGLYLAEQESPRVAFLRSPTYHYRRRHDSLVQDSWRDPAKYSDIPRYGYLELFQRVAATHGSVPIWMQNLVLYDLLYYFRRDTRMHSVLGSVDVDAAKAFHQVLPEVMRHIDTATIEGYHVSAISDEIRSALIIGVKGERLRPDKVRIGSTDVEQHLVQVRYFYGGDLPREQFRIGGRESAPVYGKCRSLTYLGQRLASERIVWLSADGIIEVTLDGRRVQVGVGRPDNLAELDAGRIRTRYRRAAAKLRPFGTLAHRSRRYVLLRGRRLMSTDRRIKRHAAGDRGRPYRNAWVFIDRNRLAGDNAEHLCRFVMNHHPQINAWFVVDRDTKDWSRLERDGFQLVQYGTPEHVLLMLNCVELISSQIDHYIVHPVDSRRFGGLQWRFTFLQHGVTKDDLSRWLNRRPISRFITATELEYRSIAGDNTPYVFTDKEVRLTGFPRHDRLTRIGREPRVLDADRLLLLMPTWRRELVGDATRPGGDRPANPGFSDSPFARSWLELLESERLGELADRAGLRIAFVPHPNASAFLASSFPSHIDVYDYADEDIQELFARGAAIVTDYSSNAFELAYLNRAVVYYQFDRDSFFSGQHVYRRGEWSYERDGFGPVAESSAAVLDELERLVEHGMTPQQPYATRMSQAFAFRDEGSCQRVFESILSARRPPTVVESGAGVSDSGA